MAPTATELSLQSLLPTIGILPAQLLSLANTLLSQSKSKASNLKPEEEVGRIYAVSHIAAERLQNRLNLEIGKPAPPVKPRVYAKLKGYLNGVLVEPSTPKAKRVEDKLGSVVQSRSGAGRAKVESAPTSMRKKWAEARRVPVEEGGKRDVEVPRFVMGMVEDLCKGSSHKSAQPHVFVGVSEMLKQFSQPREEAPTSGRKRKRGADGGGSSRGLSDDDAAGVALTVFFLVLRRMTATDDFEDFYETGFLDAGYVERAQSFCARASIDAPALVKEHNHLAKQLERFLQLQDEWSGMEWYTNVPDARLEHRDASDAPENEDYDEDVRKLTPVSKKFAKTPLRRKEKHGTVDEMDDLGPAGLLPGLGTFFQPAVDWLSSENMRSLAALRKEVEVAARQGAQRVA